MLFVLRENHWIWRMNKENARRKLKNSTYSKDSQRTLTFRKAERRFIFHVKSNVHIRLPRPRHRVLFVRMNFNVYNGNFMIRYLDRSYHRGRWGEVVVVAMEETAVVLHFSWHHRIQTLIKRRLNDLFVIIINKTIPRNLIDTHSQQRNSAAVALLRLLLSPHVQELNRVRPYRFENSYTHPDAYRVCDTMHKSHWKSHLPLVSPCNGLKIHPL